MSPSDAAVLEKITAAKALLSEAVALLVADANRLHSMANAGAATGVGGASHQGDIRADAASSVCEALSVVTARTAHLDEALSHHPYL